MALWFTTLHMRILIEGVKYYFNINRKLVMKYINFKNGSLTFFGVYDVLATPTRLTNVSEGSERSEICDITVRLFSQVTNI